MPRVGLDRERLVLAGAELADEVGFAGVTLAALAARFEVRAPSLYTHVRGSADLSTAIARLALSELADLVSVEVAGRAGRAALAGFAGAYRDYARSHPGRYAATRFRLDPSAVDLTDVVAAGRRHAELSRSVLRGYAVPEGEHVHAVRLLGSTVHGFIALESSGSFDHSDPAPEISWSRTIDVLDRALTDWPRA